MNEIAEIINGTPSAASQFIQKLEKKQYVKRETNMENRREVFVYLDEKGKQFFTDMTAIDERVLGKYFLRLPEEDIIKYHEKLKKLHHIVVSGGET
ncbi:MarR family winged helix-turn-helix transcriptional regulator [Robertmurraya sp. GLU-23]